MVLYQLDYYHYYCNWCLFVIAISNQYPPFRHTMGQIPETGLDMDPIMLVFLVGPYQSVRLHM